MHPFAWSLARRTLVALGASTALAAAAVVATDEPTNTAAMRIARMAALAPLLSCIAVLAVCAHARARGELRALAALGVSPWQACRGAALVGLMMGAAALVGLAGPWSDASSLFPRVLPAIGWVMSPDGYAAHFGGVTVFADGAIDVARMVPHRTPAGPGAGAALECVAPLALGVPAFAVTPMSSASRAAALLATAASLIVVLHLVAAGRLNGALGPIAGLPLFVALVSARARG